ncbi:VOC family protein [Flavobacteriaceae bacterium]|nr:VOC family protein [Flavobacteriaceae bacterium]MDB4087261.1 VOC family protein [Flavobacteriaceae bacterium]
MNKLSPFHLAIPVSNLEKNRAFYKNVLECLEGRSSDHWIDFNFFGHQLVIHLDDNINKENSNPVDGKNVPIPHFGVVLEWKVFKEFAEKLKKRKIEFIIEPYVRFKGLTGEQATMFFKDPSGNALEFKSFKDPSQIFAN